MMRTAPILILTLALPVAAQESGKVTDLVFHVADLQYNVTDLAGNPVSEVGGAVQDLEVAESDTEVRIEMAADVLFDFDKADILPKAEETLGKAAAIIRERAKGPVRILGYTDSKGGDAYNQRLSERRANSVRNWLRDQGGLAAVTFETTGMGSANPVAPNQNPDGSDNPEGRQKNRRVEIIMRKLGG